MTRRAFRWAFLAIFGLGTACIPTLNPIFKESDPIFEPRLVGHWTAADPGEDAVVDIEKGEGNGYRLASIEGGHTSRFAATLIRIGDNLFIDLYPDPGSTSEDVCGRAFLDQYSPHYLPAHTFYKVILSDQALTFKGLDSSWLAREAAQGRLGIHLQRFEPFDWLITSSTEELQDFLRTFGNDPAAFSVDTHLKKE